jgi:acetyl-CoA C-acetyltransferase
MNGSGAIRYTFLFGKGTARFVIGLSCTMIQFGVYSATPPRREFGWEDVQSAVDAEPSCVGEVDWSGVGSVESWTTPFTRDGEAEKAFLAVRTPAGARALAVITDAGEAVATTREDIAGARVTVHCDGTANLR